MPSKSCFEVWKFTLKASPKGPTEMPIGAKILSVAEQHGNVCVWALCDPTAEKELRHFEVYGTGHMIQDAEELTHLGTALFDHATFVFHVFERKSANA